jgi:hypothetical protein
MATTKKRKYGKAAGKAVESAMRRRKRGTLKSGKGGKGGKVRSRKQAIAIGLSEAREKGAKVPAKRKSRKTASKSGARKKTTRKTSSRKKAGSRKKTTRKSSGRKTSARKKSSGRKRKRS